MDAGPFPAIQIQSLTKYYGSTLALDSIDLEVGRGEIFGFLGPNGAGKSTAIRVMLDLIRPSGGSVRVFGHDSRADSIRIRGMTGYLPGEASHYDQLSGRAMLDLLESLSGRAAIRRDELLHRLDLDPSARIARFSRGMKQKLALAGALQSDPPLLVLDEPTTGLDPLIQQELHGYLQEAAGRGTTVFFSSHVLSEVEELCDRVAFIREGKIVAVDRISELRNRLVKPVEVEFAESVDAAEFGEIEGVSVTSAEGSRLTFAVTSGMDGLVKALAERTVIDLDSVPPSLEETFLHLYESDRRGNSKEAEIE